MARYQFWDGKSDIYTPVGERLTAEQWAERYPWCRIPGVKMIIGGGVINGSVCNEFSMYLEMAEHQGFVRDPSWTDEETLAEIEKFENQSMQMDPTKMTPDPQERVAAAMELQNMLQLADVPTPRTAYAYSKATFEPESAAFGRVKSNYDRGLWTANIVAEAVHKGYILPIEYQAIVGERYVE